MHVRQLWCQSFSGFYLYVPTRAQMQAKVRALIDFLAEKRGALGRLWCGCCISATGRLPS